MMFSIPGIASDESGQEPAGDETGQAACRWWNCAGSHTDYYPCHLTWGQMLSPCERLSHIIFCLAGDLFRNLKEKQQTKTNTYPFVWQSEQSKIWLYLFQQKVKNNYPNFGSEHSSVKSNETCWCRWLNTVVLCLLHHGYILKGDHTWGSVTGRI